MANMTPTHDAPHIQHADASAATDELRPRGGRANEIRSALQEEIESGKLPPGAPLDERALAARFQVSRATSCASRRARVCMSPNCL